MSVNRMTGTPWHVEYLKGIVNPKFFRFTLFKTKGSKCNITGLICEGPARCGMFIAKDQTGKKKGSSGVKKKSKEKSPPKDPKYAFKPRTGSHCPYPAGTEVQSTIYGHGIITNVEGNKVTIKFGSIEKKFSFPECQKHIVFNF